ncbi:hypothetical protein [Coralloluteibacterium thermophilus]|uniref:Uncharacterized protein n=1 Tax=Coralloluteibacterium thermophilum TaxID=2707049 RepID=A0ABV9NFH9_9GAMM
MKAWAALGATVALVAPAYAQAPDSGASRLGRALAGGDRIAEEAAQRRMYDRAQLEAAMQEIRASRLRQEQTQTEQYWQSALLATYVEQGLPEAEARAISATYRISPEGAAMLHTVRRIGVEQAARDARAALDRHDHRVANDLIVAAIIVMQELGAE